MEVVVEKNNLFYHLLPLGQDEAAATTVPMNHIFLDRYVSWFMANPPLQ